MTRMADLPSQVKRIWRHSFQTELDRALEQHLRAHALAAVQGVLERALIEEVEQQRHAATVPALQHAYRSGYFTRHVLTSFGPLPALRVPKLRRGNRLRDWQILQRYLRTMPVLLDQLCYLYTMGLSMRDLEEGVYVLFGDTLSRGAINRVTQAAHGPMHEWLDTPITDTPPVFIIDGVWVSIQYPTGETWVDRSGHQRQRVRAQERVLLTVLGVWPDGRHQVLQYQVAQAEDQAAWVALWQTLRARGLDAAQVQVVVSDGAKGVLEALRQELPSAQLQRCTVHKVRGFERYLRYEALTEQDAQGQALSPEQARHARRHAMKTEALAIFEAATRTEAEARRATFVATWPPLEPAAVQNFTRGLQRCMTFYQVDATLHPLIRSTNLLERFFRDVRAKTDEIGAFPNEESCLVIVHLIMLREHAKHDRFPSAKTS
jgi:transposase-like protein